MEGVKETSWEAAEEKVADLTCDLATCGMLTDKKGGTHTPGERHYLQRYETKRGSMGRRRRRGGHIWWGMSMKMGWEKVSGQME